jgi:hypothetical protein
MTKEELFFHEPDNIYQKQYEALRAFYYEKKQAKEVAKKFGYKVSAFYSLVRDFKISIKQETPYSKFFKRFKLGKKPRPDKNEVDSQIIELRKIYLSVEEIKVIMDAKNVSVSEGYIYGIIQKEGFARLPRRSKEARKEVKSNIKKIEAPKAEIIESKPESFNTSSAGLLSFLPYIKAFGIDKIIADSDYPETKTLPKLNSILSFIALKLSNNQRYTQDDLWCMDRGLGLFAGLNVLPKAAWFTSYSHRITRDHNINFLKSMHKLWAEKGLLSDTANLDFTSIPYWGDDSHLENNWSGKRNQAMSSILAALAHDPDSGIITYGDTNVRHSNESDVAIEVLDFYRKDTGSNLKYLVFDSKFTTYQNLKN